MRKGFIYSLGGLFIVLAIITLVGAVYIRPEYRNEPFYIQNPTSSILFILGLGFFLFAYLKK